MLVSKLITRQAKSLTLCQNDRAPTHLIFSSTHQMVDFTSRARAGGRSMTDTNTFSFGNSTQTSIFGSSSVMQTRNSTRGHLRPMRVVRQAWVSLCEQDNPTGMVTGRKANTMTVPDTQANFVRHERCENCGSSDANARYDDGHAFCFSCETYSPPEEEGEEPSGSTSPASQLQATDTSQQKTLLTGEIKAIPARA